MNKFETVDKLDEEFNNFMIKVNEVGSIIEKLASNDKELQKIGDIEAKRYLGDDKEKIMEDLNDEQVILQVKSNKTLVNRKAIEDCQKDQSTMSQGKFYEVVIMYLNKYLTDEFH